MSCATVVSPIEIFSAADIGRRRDWSVADKIRIVEESLRGYRQGSATARRYGLSRSVLSIWRREYRSHGNSGFTRRSCRGKPQSRFEYFAGTGRRAGLFSTDFGRYSNSSNRCGFFHGNIYQYPEFCKSLIETIVAPTAISYSMSTKRELN